MKHKLYWFFFYLMVILYMIAGVNHFVNPEFYENMMPSYIPFHLFCIYFSGICEVLLALLLVPTRTRKLAGWLIVCMLIVFFVIHIHMLIDSADNNDHIMFAVSIIRIPIQFVLIWWAWLYTKNPQPNS